MELDNSCLVVLKVAIKYLKIEITEISSGTEILVIKEPKGKVPVCEAPRCEVSSLGHPTLDSSDKNVYKVLHSLSCISFCFFFLLNVGTLKQSKLSSVVCYMQMRWRMMKKIRYNYIEKPKVGDPKAKYVWGVRSVNKSKCVKAETQLHTTGWVSC